MQSIFWVDLRYNCPKERKVFMNVGYVRLSRDDDKKNYTSIENQKLVIRQEAAERGFVIDRWYEDDGVSGYTFNRPDFIRMMEDLDQGIERILVKDFSRLGRHNAKVLLMLDELRERGKQLIVIDDNYDSMEEEDEGIIGIKTWYNERYVKDISKKIKRSIGARQKAGSLVVLPPFGYKRNEKDKLKIEIEQQEAECIKMIYDLYIKGAGYRKIAMHLNELQFPTPSMVLHEREVAEGRVTKRKVAHEWSDNMVKEIIYNDYYTGTLRLGKRARATIHGKDKRIPKEEQYVFEDAHPAIIDKVTFELVQTIRANRVKSNYKGSHGPWTTTENPNPFGSCLYCKDCGNKLTPAKRKTAKGERKYYVCSTYNMKGKRYCRKSHLMEEKELMKDVMTYLKLCRNSLYEVIAAYNMEDFDSEKKLTEEKREDIQNRIDQCKKQLKTLFTQKVRDLTNASGNEDIVNETYDALQKSIIEQIHMLKDQLRTLEKAGMENADVKEKLKNALQVVDRVIERGYLNRKDIEILIERIDVDEDGVPEIKLRYGLSGKTKYDAVREMNRCENEIIYHILKSVMEENRKFTSAKYLSKAITAAGFKKSAKSILPYINIMIELGIVEPSGDSLKPYTIMKTKEEIQKILNTYSWAVTSGNKIATDLHSV